MIFKINIIIKINNKNCFMLKIENFKSTFLNFDFDKNLIDQNNSLVNSNEYYLVYKNNYLKSTQDNLENYIKLNDQYESLSNNELVTDTGKVKYYISNANSGDLDNIKLEMNKILISQRKIYENFIKYIEFLNESKTKIVTTNKQTSVKSSAKKFFSKLAAKGQ